MEEPRRSPSQYESLDADRIVRTIRRLCDRIEARFPGSGLHGVGRRLHDVANHTRSRVEWIGRPLIWARLVTVVLIMAIALTPLVVAFAYRPSDERVNIAEFLQGLEAGVNDIILFGAAIYFLLRLEARFKRRRALTAIHELRAIAHIIDMHQLTKDPEHLRSTGILSDISPPVTMSRFDLGRYLDYCSEMLSLTGKVGALYVQHFDDAIAIASVNEVEQLCTSLSRKIWQKIMVLPVIGRDDPARPAAG